MSQAAQLLLSQIMLTAVALQASGNYFVFCRLAGHVDQIEVHLYTTDSTWTEPGDKTEIGFARTYYRDDPALRSWHSETEIARSNEQCIKQLEFMLAALRAYLPATSAPAQEQAA